jgi:lipoprotein-anchoring transpeptidase ErfK/SrfK
MRASIVILALALLTGMRLACAANIVVSIDKTRREMTVSINGVEEYSWPVSTGATRYPTPSGSFKSYRLKRHHVSKEWNAPMPYSIFFTPEGHAIHGTVYLKRLGRRASHGCVRLAPVNAGKLYELIKKEGLRNTTIVINR